MSNNFNRLGRITEDWLAGYVQIPGIFDKLSEASLSALRAGGKRFRPFLCLTVGEILGVPAQQLRPYALAIEMIHAASLVHDDLPGLDNSEERRGRPTVHREFGEAAAILTGDLLISEAFRVVVEADEISTEVRCRWIAELASANALICSGQLRELETGAGAYSERVIQEKTAALIRASALGAPLLVGSNLDSEKLAFWSDFGTKLGMLFQLRDDQLDSDAGAEHQGRGEELLNELSEGFQAQYPMTTYPAVALMELLNFVWQRDV